MYIDVEFRDYVYQAKIKIVLRSISGMKAINFVRVGWSKCWCITGDPPMGLIHDSRHDVEPPIYM